MIGKTISHYRIIEKLGEGGMGIVYKAEDMKLDRIVALKFLPQHIADDEKERARFLQEAKAASALNHPNVCIIYDLQEYEGQQFIIMEYVDGVTIRQKLKEMAIHESFLLLDDVLSYSIQASDALQAAHSKGITHRDVKSDNIMVTERGLVKVMDFGLAKLKGALKLTKTSSTVGTLAYMSPEQLQGKEVDARGDIFSFGVVLYEMLTGHLPFRGEYDSAMMYSILNTEPEPVTNYRPDIPSGFIHVLDRALEKDAEDRYQTMQDIIIELRRLKRDTSKVHRKIVPEMPAAEAAEQAVPDVPAGRPSDFKRAISRTSLLYIGAALVVLLVVLGYFLRRGEGVPAVPQFTNTKQVTATVGAEDFPTWSPEGGRLAYQWKGDIWVKQVTEGSPMNLTEDYGGDDLFPSWSPDGSQIAFWSARDGGGYFVMAALGGSPRKVLPTKVIPSIYRPGSPQWSPKGEELACIVIDSTGAFVEIVSLQLGTSRRMQLPGRGRKFDLSWSPDGQYFTYVTSVDRVAPNAQVWVMQAEDGEGFPVTDGEIQDWSPSWSGDGRTLYFVSNRGGSFDLWQQRMGDDGKPTGSPQQFTTGLEIRNAKFSPDGTKLAYSKGRLVTNVWRVPIVKYRAVTWADAEQITFGQVRLSDLLITPDGRRLVFKSYREKNPHLWVIEVEDGEMKRITTDPFAQNIPTLSPDGREVAYHTPRGTPRGESRHIWAASLDDGTARQVTKHEAGNIRPAWSPDGREIAFISGRSGNLDVWVIPAQGGEARQVTVHPAREFSPRWSTDGKWIIFTSNRAGEDRLWQIPAEGGKPELMTDSIGMLGVRSKDGKKIFFTRGGNVWEVAVEGGEERQLTDMTGRSANFVTNDRVQTDGEYFYFLSSEDLGDLWVMDVVGE